MTSRLKLVLFDVDGTLVDSQASIVGAMASAFETANLKVPERAAILSIVGLSLEQAMARLVPEHSETVRADLVQGYRDAYLGQRLADGTAQGAPLYPGAKQTINRLNEHPDVVLGVATGKSRRGLDAVLAGHGLDRVFVTRQVADHHPSKPHPSMILSAMAETGMEPDQTVMIGDTSFDMEMARAAGVTAIGVSWGYHTRCQLGQAHQIIDGFDQLHGVLDDIWKVTE